jgi:hypothetical protein
MVTITTYCQAESTGGKDRHMMDIDGQAGTFYLVHGLGYLSLVDVRQE